MKAVRIQAFGGTDTLRYEDAPQPTPAADEVLVQVRAAAVNQFDVKIRAGDFEKMIPHQLPLTLGWDVAGTVAAVGDNVKDFAVSDAVYALADFTRNGAYAEYVLVKAASLARKPTNLTYLEAASVPMAAATARLALYDTAQLAAGQTVLIHGAAGSVGGFAVQLAKARGARVIGTASGDDLAYVTKLGADQVIDYHNQQFETLVRDVDVVLDPLGGKTQDLSWQVLREGGILVSTVQPPKPPTGKRGEIISVEPSGDALRELTALIEASKLTTLVQQVLPLSEAKRAQELLLQKPGKPGKIVLEVVN